MANAESMISGDYLNEYVCLWMCLEINRPYRVKGFSERYMKIKSSPDSDKKIEELNNLANRCNELLSQSPLNKKQLKELTVKAAEICQGEEGKNHWIAYLSSE